MSAGSRIINLLSAPLNFHVLQALEHEPRQLDRLRREAGSPPPTTMRVYMKTLSELGIVERRQQNLFPGTVEYALTDAGQSVMRVAHVLQHWLDESPHDPIQLGTPAAKQTVKALIDGWSANIVRAVAARAATLGELARVIPTINYPTLERRLGAMRHAGLLEPLRNGGRGTAYKATDWLHRSIGPLTAGLSWEQRQIPASASPVSRTDVEATFLMAVRLLELPESLSGRCRLAVELHDESTTRSAGVLLTLEEGQLLSCVSRLDGEVDASASGSPLDWFRWMVREDPTAMNIDGDCDLAEGIALPFRAALVETERL